MKILNQPLHKLLNIYMTVKKGVQAAKKKDRQGDQTESSGSEVFEKS